MLYGGLINPIKVHFVQVIYFAESKFHRIKIFLGYQISLFVNLIKKSYCRLWLSHMAFVIMDFPLCSRPKNQIHGTQKGEVIELWDNPFWKQYGCIIRINRHPHAQIHVPTRTYIVLPMCRFAFTTAAVGHFGNLIPEKLLKSLPCNS